MKLPKAEREPARQVPIGEAGETDGVHPCISQMMSQQRRRAMAIGAAISEAASGRRIFMRNHAVADAWPAAEARRPAGHAGAVRRVEPAELNPLSRKVINGWRGGTAIAVTAKMVRPERIDVQVQDSHRVAFSQILLENPS